MSQETERKQGIFVIAAFDRMFIANTANTLNLAHMRARRLQEQRK
ncbi:hypothetical protein [Neisseria cinerea]|nr:hypothetical protein [Neisseria cinerea]